jgi:CDP-diacylglycerol---glycerol-3-phosphate 3-phosphatidyltransferase
MLQGKALTSSNALSFVRIVLIFPIFQSLSQNTPAGNVWALGFMGLAVISDFLDGFLARRLGQISDLGKILDPLADKVCIISVCWILSSPVRDNPIPAWFLVTVLARDAFVVGTSYIILKRKGFVVSSNIWGKTTSTVIAFMLMIYVLQIDSLPAGIPGSPEQLEQFLLWLSLSFLVVSTTTYGYRFYTLMLPQNKMAGMLGSKSGAQTQQNSSQP